MIRIRHGLRRWYSSLSAPSKHHMLLHDSLLLRTKSLAEATIDTLTETIPQLELSPTEVNESLSFQMQESFRKYARFNVDPRQRANGIFQRSILSLYNKPPREVEALFNKRGYRFDKAVRRNLTTTAVPSLDTIRALRGIPLELGIIPDDKWSMLGKTPGSYIARQMGVELNELSLIYTPPDLIYDPNAAAICEFTNDTDRYFFVTDHQPMYAKLLKLTKAVKADHPQRNMHVIFIGSSSDSGRWITDFNIAMSVQDLEQQELIRQIVKSTLLIPVRDNRMLADLMRGIFATK